MRALALLVLSTVGLAVHGAGYHCTSYSTSAPEVHGGSYYVDADCPPILPATSPCGPTTLWGYEETNGIAGLQRGDPTVDDTCHGLIASDSVVF